MAKSGRVKRGLFAGMFFTAMLVFAALGVWQLERHVWKLDLIAAAESRVSAPAQPAPPPAAWPGFSAAAQVYSHVQVSGRLLRDRSALVQAVTERGGGFWVLTPLRIDSAWTVLVNRGFVPPERVAASRSGDDAAVTITGLLRPTEPGGGFLQSNDPPHDRWFSRDVAAIAAARGLGPVAPYFIDADATPNPGGFPVGGLTVIAFRNAHLIYALTWFALAALNGYALWTMRRVRLSARPA